MERKYYEEEMEKERRAQNIMTNLQKMQQNVFSILQTIMITETDADVPQDKTQLQTKLQQIEQKIKEWTKESLELKDALLSESYTVIRKLEIRSQSRQSLMDKDVMIIKDH